MSSKNLESTYINKKSIPANLCKYFIKFFLEKDKEGMTEPGIAGGEINKDIKDTTDLSINLPHFLYDDEHRKNIKKLTGILWKDITEYHNRFMKESFQSLLDNNNMEEFSVDFIKSIYGEKSILMLMSSYKHGKGGYHAYHTDWSPANSRRFITWTAYLNDVKEGGETEFLKQKVKINPEEGKTITFPPFYTHIHRGLVPQDVDKFIISCWVSLL